MKYPRDGNTEEGFTLIEVLVSLCAMALGFMLLWGLHFSSVRMEMGEQRRSEAIQVARRNIELLRGDDNTTRTSCPDPTPGLLPSDTACSVAIVVPAAPEDWQRRVTVTVAWRERRTGSGQSQAPVSTQQSVQLMSIFGDH